MTSCPSTPARGWSRHGGAIVLALALVAAFATPAVANPLANPSDAKALDHLRLGNRHLDLENYDEAIEQYEAGALIEPAPIFWLNIGLAHRKAGRYAEAARVYRTFLSKIADTPDSADIRAQVEEVIRAMEDAANKPPTQAEPSSGAQTSQAEPAAQPREPARQPVNLLTTGRKVSLFVGGGGLVALGAGVFFGIRSRGYEDDAALLCPTSTCDDADRANELLEDADAAARNANIAYVVGGVAIAGAAALWFFMGPEDSSSGVVAAPYVTPASAGVQLTARF